MCALVVQTNMFTHVRIAPMKIRSKLTGPPYSYSVIALNLNVV